MAMYAFYAHRQDGAAVTFEAVELDDESRVYALCEVMLVSHPSATRIVVWRDDRKVFTHVRLNAALKTVLSRRTPRRS